MKLLTWAHGATLSRRMPEESYWLLWKLCVRAGSLSVLDWQVTFPPNVATVKSANLPTLMRPSHRWRKRNKGSFRRSYPAAPMEPLLKRRGDTSVDLCTTFGLRVD